MRYPHARRLDLVEDLHGHRVADPYRWLEDPLSAETTAWRQAQEALTSEHLSGLPGREALRARLEQLLATGSVGTPAWRAGQAFFMRRLPGQEHSVLHHRSRPPRLPGRGYPRARTRGALEGAPQVGELRLGSRAAQDRDDVEAQLPRTLRAVLGEPPAGEHPQASRLARPDGLGGLPERRAGAGLDLAEHQRPVGLERDQVELALPAAPVAGEHARAPVGEVVGGQLLAVRPQGLS